MSHPEIAYVISEVRTNPETATRDELVTYLEWRGFGVSPNEPTHVLRDAVFLDLECLDMELSS